MISALLALIVPILGGVLSGFGINLIGVLSTGGGKLAVRALPLAVKLAMRVLSDDDDANDDESREEAQRLLGAAPGNLVDQVDRERKKRRR